MQAPRTGSYIDDAPRLNHAMQVWESKGAHFSRTEMAVQGLLFGLSSLPGAGIPAAILAARKQSADATIRAAYYRGQELINYNRPEYYDKDTEQKNICDVIIAKQRNGPIGMVRLTFLGEYTRFENFAQSF